MEREVTFLNKILLIALFILMLNFIFYLYNNWAITGFVTKEEVYEFYQSMSWSSRLVLWLQWTLFFVLIAYYAYKQFTTYKKENVESVSSYTQSKTELDDLYDLLKQKREISIENISKSFNVNSNLAMDWAKTLESGNLAIIDYPRFGGPILKIK